MSKKKVDEKDSTTESTGTVEKETNVKTYNVLYFDKNGDELEQLEVDASLFMSKSKKELYTTLHQMIVGYGRAKRVGTHSAKTKGEVAGSGKKPWRQKGTGRARVGTRRAPHWRGGGMTHAIKPRDYRVAMPKSMRNAALNFAFLTKLRDAEILLTKKRRKPAQLQRLSIKYYQKKIKPVTSELTFMIDACFSRLETSRISNLTKSEISMHTI